MKAGLTHVCFINLLYLVHTFCGWGDETLFFTSWFNMCTGPEESAVGQ